MEYTDVSLLHAIHYRWFLDISIGEKVRMSMCPEGLP
jgi:hypothetical protein